MPPESDAPGNEPNLELPSFGLGRKKKRARKSEEKSADVTPAAPESTATSTADAPAASSPETTSSPETPAASATAPARPAGPRAPVAPPAPARAPGAAPTPARPAARPPARPPARPAAAAATTPAPKPAPAKPTVHPPTPPASLVVPPPQGETPASPSSEPETEAGTEPTAVLETTPAPIETGDAVDPISAAAAALDAPPKTRRSKSGGRADARAARRAEKAARREEKASRRAEAAYEDEAEPVAEPVAEPAEVVAEEETGRERLAPADALVARLPAINPLVAAILTGAFSGLAAVLLAFGAARGCEQVRSTDSCGGGLGLLALVVILALEVVIGANLLKAWRISDPFSTSFLGVGLVATLAMLIFLNDLNSSWMLLVIPLMTAAAFALSWWVTVRFIDEYDEHPPGSVPEDANEDSNA